MLCTHKCYNLCNNIMDVVAKAISTANSATGCCRGLEQVAVAEEHLQSGKSIGKVVVQLTDDVPIQPPSSAPKL